MSAAQHGSTAPRSEPFLPPGVAPLIGIGAAAVIGLDLAGALSGVVSGHGWAWPAGGLGQLLAGVKAVWHSPVDPAAAWPTEPRPGGGVLFWTVAAVLAGTAAWVGWLVWGKVLDRRYRARGETSGMAGRDELKARRLTERAAMSKAIATREPLQGSARKTLDPVYTVVNVGAEYYSGEQLWLQQRDCAHVFGPTGGGKTWSLAVPRCWDAPGFLLATSTRADLPAATFADRTDRGQVGFFDPEGLTGLPEHLRLRWALMAGCEDPSTAIRRAHGLVQAIPMGNVTNQSYWEQKASTILRCFLHAAAVSETRIPQVRLWAMSLKPKRPIDILKSEMPDWAVELEQIYESESDSLHDMIGAVARVFAPLADPKLLAAVDCPREESADLADYVLGEDRSGTAANTIYAMSAGGNASVAPIIAAFTFELYELAKHASQQFPGYQLPVPARYVLDEVNNVAPIPDLPGKMTDSGGRGINLWAFSHNYSQVLDHWGQYAGDQFAKSAPARIVLPGLGDERELNELARLCGTRTVYDSPHHTAREVPRMTSAQIREMPDDQALMLYRNAAPALLRLPSVWTNKNRAAHVKASSELFDTMRSTGKLPAAGITG